MFWHQGLKSLYVAPPTQLCSSHRENVAHLDVKVCLHVEMGFVCVESNLVWSLDTKKHTDLTDMTHTTLLVYSGTILLAHSGTIVAIPWGPCAGVILSLVIATI